MPIIYRSTKGSALTIAEADGNFSYLSEQLALKVNTADYTASSILTRLLTVDGAGSGLDADLLDGKTSATTNTVNTIVSRDSSGNFSAGTITSNLVGNVTGNLTGNVTGNVTGTATNVSGVVAVVNGGTGVSDVNGIKTLLSLGTLSTQNYNNVTITGGSISGLSDPIPIASGGTSATTAAAARTQLGVNIGTDVQAYSSLLTALSAIPLVNNGILVKDTAGTAVVRSLTSGSSISITNSDGISGNPTISLANSPALTGTPTAPTASAGTNTTQIATTAFVKSAVDTSATTLTQYVDSNIATVTQIATVSSRIKALINFDFSYNTQTSNMSITINKSLSVTAVTYMGLYSGSTAAGVYIFRVTLNNGTVSDGNYIVSGMSDELALGSSPAYNPFAVHNLNTTRFDIYAYITMNGGNIRAMVVE